MTPSGYAITVTMFSLAYAIFEVPSNWVMKHYVRPSLWLGFLLAAWGCVTLGFAGVQNYASVLSLRLLIGIVSSDSPICKKYTDSVTIVRGWLLSGYRILHHNLVPT